MSLAVVSFELQDGVPVAVLEGEVDAANCALVLSDLTAPLENNIPGLVVDLNDARYLDSAGINVLFELSELLAARRLTLRLVIEPAAHLSRILDLSGVRSTIPVHDDVPDALGAVRA